jgi:DNA-binding NtrC family response regulator
VDSPTAPPSDPDRGHNFRLIPASDGERVAIPGIDDLIGCLRFSPREGRIWFDNDRIALIHLSSLGSIRQQLIDKAGPEAARGLLTRMGYTMGAKDAEIARKLRSRNSLLDMFLVGPQLHTLRGLVLAEPVQVEADVATGHFYGDVIWHGSFDADNHLAAYGRSDHPVCWIQLGYATGYTSAFMGLAVRWKEVECRAKGDPHCRIVGKPLDQWAADEIEQEVRALQPLSMQGRNSTAANGREVKPPLVSLGDLVGASPGFVSTCHMLQKVARTSATVLFRGDTGVGKGRFARTLHQISARADQPFVALNCAAIPENLIEAELFGVEKGAYTGAIRSRPGRFERAHGGTLFLDEVGMLSKAAQIKLLRAIQQREIERVGDSITRRVDVRIIAATNEDLDQAVKAGRFREDLLYRLNVFPIQIPPLRERREDIPLLMSHFLHRYTELHGRDVTGFTSLAVDALYEYDYPGNIREMENLIERAVIQVEDGQPIDIRHLFVSEELLESMLLKLNPLGALQPEPKADTADSCFDDVIGLGLPLEEVEYGLITEALRRADGNMTQAARLLGVKRSHLAYRVKKRQQ